MTRSDQERSDLRILFAGHLLHFLHPFLEYLRARSGYSVSIDHWEGHSGHDEATSRMLVEAAEVVFCEWCLGNAVWYSRRKVEDQRLVVRLHRQEFYGRARRRYLSSVDWGAVDAAIVIAPIYKELLARLTGLKPARIHFVPNLFETGRFDRRKATGALHRLGLVKYGRRKRPDLALEILEELVRRDSRFSLRLVGKRPEEVPWIWDRPEEREPVLSFLASVERSPCRASVVFDPYTGDMPRWFSGIGFVLSTSDNEGSHQAVAEGMASGCVPVIRNWPGADRLYPRRFIFSTTDEAVQLVLNAAVPEQFSRLSQRSREWARARFDTHAVGPRLLSLLAGKR